MNVIHANQCHTSNRHAGFGPEHYIAPSVFLGPTYMIQIDMFSYDQETDVDVNWQLQAHSFGELLWTQTGRFHMGETPTESDLIPWVFDEEPFCEQVCTIAEEDNGDERNLADEFPFCLPSQIPKKYPWYCGLFFISCDEEDATAAWKFYQEAKTLTSRSTIKGVVSAIYAPAVEGLGSSSTKESLESALGFMDDSRVDPSCVLDIAM